MVLNFPPQRIICLTEETVETLYLLGEEKRIVGVTGYAVRPNRVRLEKQRVGSFITVNIEKIKKLKPELILTFSDVQANLTKQLILEGFNVICFNQKSISEIFSMIKYLGSLVGNIEGAIDLVIKLDNQINIIMRKNNKFKPKVILNNYDLYGKIIEELKSENFYFLLALLPKNQIFLEKCFLNNSFNLGLLKMLGILESYNPSHIFALTNIYYLKSPFIKKDIVRLIDK